MIALLCSLFDGNASVSWQAKARRPAFLGFCSPRSICCLLIFAIVAAAVIATAQKSETPKSEFFSSKRNNIVKRLAQYNVIPYNTI